MNVIRTRMLLTRQHMSQGASLVGLRRLIHNQQYKAYRSMVMSGSPSHQALAKNPSAVSLGFSGNRGFRWYSTESKPQNENQSTGEASSQPTQQADTATAAAASGVEEAASQPNQQGDTATAAAAGGATAEGEDDRVSELEHELIALQSMVNDAKKEVEESRDRMARILAEADNIRRISKRDVENAHVFGISKFAKSLLDVADNLERALGSVKLDKIEGDDANVTLLKGLHEGVAATHRELLKVFSLNGVAPYGALGEDFDPNIHNALFEAPHPDYPDGKKVINIVKIGYKINERVLRPADVGVSKAN